MTLVLPRGRGVRRFGLAGLLNATGTGVFYPYALIVLPRLTGLPLSLVGPLLTVTVLLVLPLLTPVGRAVDRWGPRSVLVVACLCRVVAYLGYAFLPGLAPFVLCSVVIALANRAEQISTPALAAAVAPEGESGRWLAMSRAVFNAGVGLGAVLGGLVVAHGRWGAVLVSLGNAGSFAAAAALAHTLPSGVVATARTNARPTPPWRDPAFRRASLSVALLWFAALAVEATVPLVLVARLGLPAWLVGLLFLVNTVLLAALQLPVSAWLTRHDDWSVLAAGAVLYLALPVGLALLGLGGADGRLRLAIILLAPAMIVYTAGEMVAGQSGAILLNRLPPSERRGGYLAFHQKLIGVGSAAAPGAVTTALAAGQGVLLGGLGLVVLVAAASALTGGIRFSDGGRHGDH